MKAQLVAPVETLGQLKTTLELLQEISDLQNTIDGLYLPVEELYTLLRYVCVCVPVWMSTSY